MYPIRAHLCFPTSEKNPLSIESRLMMGDLNSIALVVDDNADIRELITQILEEENFIVHSAAEATSALSLIHELQPDLLLLDVMMPGKSGIDLLCEIRASQVPLINELPVLIITAKSQAADIEIAMSAGANSYIVKPFRSVALMEKISSLLSNGARI